MARKITVIPASSKAVTPSKDNQKGLKRVAAYCRVSTELEDQLHSFEAQVSYYTDYINGREDYVLADIYADEGISATSTRKRDEFKRMIRDCENGMVDMIITKSISRFARNTQDCLYYSRKLKKLGIGIYFEKENINTLDASGELLFTILSSLAQDESRNISENSKWGIRSKFKKGELHINTDQFLGYDKDEDGKLIINGEQAKTVRRIYDEFLWGKNPQQIASDLTDEKIPNGRGNTKWYTSTVIGILTNEKHKGDALLQKYYTEDFINKRLIRNHGEVTQYYVTDSHEAIVDKQTWEAVQEEFSRRKNFCKEHNLKNYTYGNGWNVFTGRVFCGECGSVYIKQCWKSRGIVQWQCKNHRTDGFLTCKNRNVKQEKLEQGFVKAFNSIYKSKEAFIAKKQQETQTGKPLQKIRAEQMIELIEQPPMECFIPELAQMVLESVIVFCQDYYEFHFLDGTVKKVNA